MKFSMKGDYGVRALTDLAQHYGQVTVQTSEIAQRQFIPEPYLDQLLTTLRKGGFIRSRRGPRGGHILAKPPGEITLREVVEALEGSLSVIGCLDGTINCPLTGGCGQQEVWDTVTRTSQRLLEGITIGDLLERQSRLQARAMYFI